MPAPPAFYSKMLTEGTASRFFSFNIFILGRKIEEHAGKNSAFIASGVLLLLAVCINFRILQGLC
jgi:hypothetical protein